MMSLHSRADSRCPCRPLSEAARVLVRSITDDPDLIRPGEEKVRWVVLHPKMMIEQPERPPARFDAAARKEK
jgi:hypothetical protein